MQKRILLLGVDPGSTIGYSILDIDGKLIEVDSSKTLSLSALRLNTISYGKVILVSTDKNPPPKFAIALSNSLGARLFYPKFDLRIEEKKELIKNHKTRNSHQRDALSSAILAYKKITPLLSRIKKHTTQNNFEQVADLVITKKLSISQAISHLDQKPEVSQIKKQTKTYIGTPKINPLKEQNQLLNLENKRLKEVIKKLKSQKQKILSLLDQKTIQEKQKARNQISINTYQELLLEIEKHKEQIKYLQHKIQKQNRFLSNLDDKIIIKKLDSLSFIELTRKLPILDIKKGDMLYIKNPNEFSKKTLDFLRDKITVIIVPKKSSLKQFTQIEEKDLDLEQIGNYAKISRSKLNQKLQEKSLLFEIIEDYKSKREKNYMS